MANLYRDDNEVDLSDVAGLRPKAIAAGIVSATTGGATAEVSLATIAPAFSAASATNVRTQNGEVVARVVCFSNPCFIAFDAAGAAANHTGVTDMIYVPKDVAQFVKLIGTDVSLYHLQSGGAGTLQLCVMQ